MGGAFSYRARFIVAMNIPVAAALLIYASKCWSLYRASPTLTKKMRKRLQVRA